MGSRRCFTVDEALAELMREDDEEWLLGAPLTSSSEEESEEDIGEAVRSPRRSVRTLGEPSSSTSTGSCERRGSSAPRQMARSQRHGDAQGVNRRAENERGCNEDDEGEHFLGHEVNVGDAFCRFFLQYRALFKSS